MAEPDRQDRYPNLKRGKGGNTGSIQTVLDARVREGERQEQIAKLARVDPDEVLLELFTAAAQGTIKLMGRWTRARSGQAYPPKVVIEASRETRQLADAVYKIMQARGARAEAQEFFTELGERLDARGAEVLATAAPYLEQPT
jgi:hypothetical protein